MRGARLGILEALDTDELAVVGKTPANWKNKQPSSELTSLA